MRAHGRFHPRMRGRPQVVANPATLFASGEQGWWLRMYDVSTLFQDTAGTVPVTSLGQNVARINDMSGRGNHFTQASVPAQGVYSLDAFGRPGVFFTGATFYSCASLAFGSSAMTMWVGAAATGGSGQAMLCEFGTNSSSQNGSFGLIHPINTVTSRCSPRSRGTAASSFNEGGAMTVRRRVYTFFADIATASNNVTTENDGTYSDATSQGTGNYLTYPAYLGARAGTSLFYTGHSHELIVRAGVTAQATRVDIANYVNTHVGAY